MTSEQSPHCTSVQRARCGTLQGCPPGQDSGRHGVEDPFPVSGLTIPAASPANSTRPSGWNRGLVESGRCVPPHRRRVGFLTGQQGVQGVEELLSAAAAATVEHAVADI